MDQQPPDEGAEVIELFSTVDQAEQNAPIATRRRNPAEPYCGHHGGIDLVRGNRRAYCRDCGREIDCFEALQKLAGTWERYVEAWKRAKREAEAAGARLEELKRQERNIKARIRRHS